MILFGPSGNSESFYAEGYKHTYEAAAWLKNRGLTAYEYPFGRGVTVSEESAREIGGHMRANGITVSAHAPYFINLANPDPEKREHTFRYILDSAQALDWLGGDQLVVHVGSQMKMDRQEAMANCRAGLKEAYCRLADAGLAHIHLCPETMGKRSQIGDLDEICALCQTDDRLIPCIDFAHLHALGGGCLNTPADFAAVLDRLELLLGRDRARDMHVHFSTIEYSAAGERRHRTFAETDYGPRFENLAPLLRERAYEPFIICESKGTMAEDALTMKRIWSGEEHTA